MFLESQLVVTLSVGVYGEVVFTERPLELVVSMSQEGVNEFKRILQSDFALLGEEEFELSCTDDIFVVLALSGSYRI
jgi:hypothetical protein